MNIDILRGAISEKFRTQTAFAAKIGWHKNRVSLMMHGKYTPNVDEAAAIAKILALSDEKFCQIFLD